MLTEANCETAERALLGSLLLNNSAFDRLNGLKSSHFDETKNRIIFEAISASLDVDGVADEITVGHNLELNGKLQAAGGRPYLSTLTDDLPTAQNAEFYAKAVTDAYHRRSLDHALTNARESLRNGEPVDKARAYLETVDDPGRPIPMVTAAELFGKEFPPIPWAVDGFLASGLTMLAGKQKLGKSWLMLQMAYAIASGGAVFGQIRVQARNVLYLALEDGERRLQSRLLKIGAEPIDNLNFAIEWPTGSEAIKALDDYLKREPDTEVVVVDTLGRLGLLTDGNDYVDTSSQLARLKAVADKHDAAIVCVHHVRKTATDDFTDAAIGSVGIAATVDCVWILERSRGTGQAKLSVTGRDIEEKEYALSFDAHIGTWVLLGEAADLQATGERQEIFDVLRETGESMRPKDIAGILGKNTSTVTNLLRKMLHEGAIQQDGWGKYGIESVASVENDASTQDELSTVSTFSTPILGGVE